LDENPTHLYRFRNLIHVEISIQLSESAIQLNYLYYSYRGFI